MKRLTYLFVCSLAIGSIVACKQESKFQIINGIVYDATMNNITLITGKGDTVQWMPIEIKYAGYYWKTV